MDVILKFSGEGYGLTDEKHEVIVDTKQSFSVSHDGDMTTLISRDSYLTLKRATFSCDLA